MGLFGLGRKNGSRVGNNNVFLHDFSNLFKQPCMWKPLAKIEYLRDDERNGITCAARFLVFGCDCEERSWGKNKHAGVLSATYSLPFANSLKLSCMRKQIAKSDWSCDDDRGGMTCMAWF